MITPDQAQHVATLMMQSYIMECRCDTQEDIANALMKLVSVCGVGMCAVVGHADAVARLQGTTDYIASTQAGSNWRKEPMQ